VNTIGIIPARMASTRFPGKPLAQLAGMPMIGHVYYRSKMVVILDEVYVATCDEEISEYIKSINGKVIMTDVAHQRASERTAEALEKIEKISKQKIDVVTLIQGDEPMIRPEMIEAGLRPIIDEPSIQVTNLMAEIETEDYNDLNEVKVVVDRDSFALYFSREPIPSKSKYEEHFAALKQVCIISFTRESLRRFIDLEPTPLEIIESIDMNRFLENDIRIKMVKTNNVTYSVDTIADLRKVEKAMKEDNLVNIYIKQ